jgi:hypothetical protein
MNFVVERFGRAGKGGGRSDGGFAPRSSISLELRASPRDGSGSSSLRLSLHVRAMITIRGGGARFHPIMELKLQIYSQGVCSSYQCLKRYRICFSIEKSIYDRSATPHAFCENCSSNLRLFKPAFKVFGNSSHGRPGTDFFVSSIFLQ